MLVDFSAFQEIEFPRHRDIVYILHYVRNDVPLPFYVGESSRHVGRLGDYVSANFTAATDFKVGEAARHLLGQGLRVVVKFQESANRKADEKRILQELRRTYRLLNDIPGYNYEKADETDERKRIHRFIDEILEDPYCSKPIATTAKMSAPQTAVADSNLLPDKVRKICQELVVVTGNKVIKRQDILRLAEKRGLHLPSVLPADYCDNTETGKWSRHSFLHSVGRGKYTLNDDAT